MASDVTAPCHLWSSDGSRDARESFDDEDPSRNGIFAVRVADWRVRRLTTNDGASDIPGDYAPNSHRLVLSRPSADNGSTAPFRINPNGNRPP